jgi:hypothetical protein
MYCPPQKLYPHGLVGAPQVLLTGGGLGIGDGFGRGEGFGEAFGEGWAGVDALGSVVGEADGDGLGLAPV